MRIGALAQQAGVSTRSLRYYEEQGLLSAERTPGGQREYGKGAVHRVRRIQELYAAGMHSATIKRLLPCTRDIDGGPSEVADAQLALDLAHERERIREQITALKTSLAALDRVIDAASEATPDGQGGPR
ncbi:MerR family transcriptional regulator [Rothia sp. AR01]|uniref:MerR family transcriptional regulator n=1 Tax=Rothia santali TaxID=2949643 RepID=A0A9X2KJJ8_9MICC|nr:MerR family transcriptional regulator [Rothia santali]